ncbi:exonuclease domain-containing protein, partial [Shinella sp. GWS1]
MQGAQDEIDMVRRLEETGRYRVLRKLEARTIADAPRPGFPLRGVIVDTETTGLNARKDEIIEIGIVVFSFDEAGNIG